MPTQSRSVIVGTDRGGVGKTFTTAAIASVLSMQHLHTARWVEYEVERRLGAILDRLYQVEHRPSYVDTVDPEARAVDRETFWDKLVAELETGGVIYDTAANLLTDALRSLCRVMADDTGEDIVLAGGTSVGVVVPTTVERHALSAAIDTVHTVKAVLPSAPIWVLENERDGRFGAAPTRWGRFRAEAGATGVQFVPVPTLPSVSLCQHLADMRLDLLLRLETPMLMKTAGISKMQAIRERAMLVRFAAGVCDALKPVCDWYAGR